MADQKKEFEVVDKRRRYDESGSEASTTEPAKPAEAAPEEPRVEVKFEKPAPEAPPTHSAEEHAAGRSAYSAANQGMDSAFKAAGIHDFQVSYERFMTQLYMTALYQLGMLREENAPVHVDLVGARQTIDTIEMLAQKTRGNTTAAEEQFVHDRIYELHMAYLEVTQAIARASDPNAKPPQGK